MTLKMHKSWLISAALSLAAVTSLRDKSRVISEPSSGEE